MQIHDQGAGGNCNVVKEIIYPLGAEIDVRAVRVGDETLSVMEIWGAEYQVSECSLPPSASPSASLYRPPLRPSPTLQLPLPPSRRPTPSPSPRPTIPTSPSCPSPPRLPLICPPAPRLS